MKEVHKLYFSLHTIRMISLATFGHSWPQHTDKVICHHSYTKRCRFPDPFYEAAAICNCN